MPPKQSQGKFRLPVDRVFTIRGFGTVVTGTLFSGTIRVEERIEIYPRGIEAKIRGLQVHNASVAEAVAGQRTAINLQGIDKVELERGDVLGHPGEFAPTFMLDAVSATSSRCATATPSPRSRPTPCRNQRNHGAGDPPGPR